MSYQLPQLMQGVSFKSLDAEGTVGIANGAPVAVPKRSGQAGRVLTMHTYFSVAPAATDIALEGCNDAEYDADANTWTFGTWYEVINTTSVAGGAVTVPDFNFAWARAKKKAQTGAANATAEITMS